MDMNHKQLEHAIDNRRRLARKNRRRRAYFKQQTKYYWRDDAFMRGMWELAGYKLPPLEQ